MRSTWTDSRLDDLNDRIRETNGRISQLDNKVDEGFGRLDGRIDTLNRTIWQGTIALISIIAVLLAAFLTVVATHF